MKSKKTQEMIAKTDEAAQSQEEEMDRLIGELSAIRQRLKPRQARSSSRDLPRISPLEALPLSTSLRVAHRRK